MQLRGATSEDLTALTQLQRAYDAAWFGAPEHDADEVREGLDLAEAACVVIDGNRIVGSGVRRRTDASVVIDPAAAADAVHALLVPWLTTVGAPETEVLDRDESLRAALTAAGWTQDRSTFELLRPVSPGWVLAEPTWPAGVEIRPCARADAAALHRLIYQDAGWADVPGHHARDLDEWQRIFLRAGSADAAPVLAARGDRLVGAAIGRQFSDGTGWVAQLAVARDERGRGLGRALLLECMRRQVSGGATTLGLAVIATNRSALQLYLDVGLTVDREWQTFRPPG
jgi:mycothiol synthase